MWLVPVIAGMVYFTSCKNTPTEPDKAPELTIAFKNVFDGQGLKVNEQQYTNIAGNQMLFSLVKYRISQVVLHRTDGSTYSANNYEILDAGVPAQQSFTLKGMPEGSYDGISFIMGVDSTRNHTGDQTGNLDPAMGMYWAWNTGYIFIKLEGSYTNGGTQAFGLHIGTDSNLVKVNDMAITPFNLTKNDKKRLNLQFNVAEAFKTPNTIDMAVDGDFTHTVDNPVLARRIFENLNDAFSFISVEEE